MDLLRFTTAGSVDDGKSTLIGRLLYDSKSIFEDQMEAIEKASAKTIGEGVNLALLTDGLRAEREQGVTIDVAYRYFATPRRKFIIADTPGHIQYTRNMVTGASTANVAIILVDARKGIVEQTCRHSFIASLLGISHIIYAVNKMDLENYSEERYDQLRAELDNFSSKLRVKDISYVPISALKGDNVVERSENMRWYKGPTLLYVLENMHISGDQNHVDARFPVQYVIRPQTDEFHDYRGYAGRMAGGVLRVGDTVMALPSGFTSEITHISLADKEIKEAYSPMSVTIRLKDEIDISRGDMIVRENNQPNVDQDVDAMICWMHDKPMMSGNKYVIKHTTREARTMIKEIRYKMDINTLSRLEEDKNVQRNDIVRVAMRTTVPLLYDRYDRNRNTGSFILVDEGTNETVAAGMII